ncbi:MAG TPA: helix-turn-helix domain-containing protein [Longimicrobiales bacterium]
MPEPPDPVRLRVEEAARRLGISESALRKRLQRGQIPSVREGRTVWVLLPPDPSGPRPDPSPDGDMAGPAIRPDVQTLERLVATQADALADLRHQLAVREREVEQLHVLLSQALNRPALPPPRRPWWRFWAR